MLYNIKYAVILQVFTQKQNIMYNIIPDFYIKKCVSKYTC